MVLVVACGLFACAWRVVLLLLLILRLLALLCWGRPMRMPCCMPQKRCHLACSWD